MKLWVPWDRFPLLSKELTEQASRGKTYFLRVVYAALLFGQAQIAEGVALEDPARFTRLVTELMTEAVQG